MSGIRQTAPHITLDESICIGSGSCVRLAPGAFTFDNDRQVAEVGDLSAVELERLRVAERSCPTGAIFFEEEDDEPQV
ncbi:ferredoxin [Pseudonocardia nigra]|uniref:ferredoxin n=1 Tax=Pseudonocardia nigra TaxID=1921578 RepID=UPI001C5DB441|nr:ferredoxin [Pseudonocardia nigra]